MVAKSAEIIDHIMAMPGNFSWLPGDLNLDSLKRDVHLDGEQDAVAEAELDDISSFVRKNVVSRSACGFCILNLKGADSLSDDALLEKYYSVARKVGELIPQNGQGDLFYKVESNRGDDKSLRLSKFSGRTSLHTDCTYGDIRPEFTSLCCVRQAVSGGHSLLVSMYSILKFIASEQKEILDDLNGEYYFDRRGSQIDVTKSLAGKYRLLDIDGDRLNVRYKRPYMESGHRCMGNEIPASVMKSLDTFDDILNSERYQFKYLLKRGEIIFVNNRWILHDREAYTDDPDSPGRLLVRGWLR